MQGGPGHGDKSSVARHMRSLARRIENGEDQPFDLKSKIYILDTTDFKRIDFKSLVRLNYMRMTLVVFSKTTSMLMFSFNLVVVLP